MQSQAVPRTLFSAIELIRADNKIPPISLKIMTLFPPQKCGENIIKSWQLYIGMSSRKEQLLPVFGLIRALQAITPAASKPLAAPCLRRSLAKRRAESRRRAEARAFGFAIFDTGSFVRRRADNRSRSFECTRLRHCIL
jgi:hypothetical protein